MAAGIVADEVDRFGFVALQTGPCAGAGRKLQRGLRSDRPPRFEQRAGDVLRDEPLFILPALDERARDGRLQVAAVMVLRVPGAPRLVEAADPQHRLGNELESELQAFQIPFFRSDVILAENSKLVLGETEDDIGVEPGVVVVPPDAFGAVKGFRGHEHFEFIRGVFVVGEGRGGHAEYQRGGEGYSRERGWHSKIPNRCEGNRPHSCLLPAPTITPLRGPRQGREHPSSKRGFYIMSGSLGEVHGQYREHAVERQLNPLQRSAVRPCRAGGSPRFVRSRKACRSPKTVTARAL